MTVLAQPMPASPWGVELALYFVLVGIPSGLTLLACWRRASRPDSGGAADRAASLVALGLLAVAGLLLVIDLGRPERFFLMLTRFDNLGSPISIGAKVLALKGLLLVADLLLLHRSRGPGGDRLVPGDARTRGAGTVVLVLLAACSLVLAVYPVTVLDRTWMAPLAGTGGAMLVFLLTALLMGAAVQLLLDTVVPGGPGRSTGRGLRLGMLAALGTFAVAGGFAALSALGDPVAGPVVREQLGGGGGAAAWWGGSVALGTVLPAVGLALQPRRRGWLPAIAVGVLLGACVTRYLVFAVGP